MPPYKKEPTKQQHVDHVPFYTCLIDC